MRRPGRSKLVYDKARRTIVAVDVVQARDGAVGTHTAGPWRWSNNPYPDGKPYIAIEAGYGHYPEGFSVRGIMSEADGRLMAAAPELLAALQECLREHGGYTIRGECERKARAAIRKATMDGCQSGAASPEIGSVPNTAAETDGTVDDRKPK